MASRQGVQGPEQVQMITLDLLRASDQHNQLWLPAAWQAMEELYPGYFDKPPSDTSEPWGLAANVWASLTDSLDDASELLRRTPWEWECRQMQLQLPPRDPDAVRFSRLVALTEIRLLRRADEILSLEVQDLGPWFVAQAIKRGRKIHQAQQEFANMEWRDGE